MDMIRDYQETSKNSENTPYDPIDPLETPQIQAPNQHPQQKIQDVRIHSSQKMKYTAEVSLIKRTHGDLEGIRNKMGISQRKICQLLMVDPSAWTRWTKGENEAPPHIYRALQWFLLLQEKDPQIGNPYSWLQSVARPSIPRSEIKVLESELRQTILRDSKLQMEATEKKLKWLIILNIILASISIVLLGALFLGLWN